MSKLISGKEALIALANGGEVQGNIGSEWVDISVDQKLSIKSFITETNDYGGAVKFRLKPRTITINGVEVPAPFEPEYSEKYFYLNLQRECLYAAKEFNGNYSDNSAVELGAWRTEEEIKQVVEALRSVFKPQ